VKILYWDRDGCGDLYKRLEAGTFSVPFRGDGRKEIAAWELGVLLEGIDLSKGRRRKRYSLPAVQGRGGNGEAAVSERRRAKQDNILTFPAYFC